MKTKQLLIALVMIFAVLACNTKPQPKEHDKCAKEKGCGKEEGCAGKDSACACKKGEAASYSKIIAAKISIKPEKVNDFLKIFKTMTDSTLKESGCTGYQLYQNPYEKGTFLVFETYKNQVAIDQHFAASYFKSLGEKITLLVTKPNDIIIYDVAKETKK